MNNTYTNIYNKNTTNTQKYTTCIQSCAKFAQNIYNTYKKNNIQQICTQKQKQHKQLQTLYNTYTKHIQQINKKYTTYIQTYTKTYTHLCKHTQNIHNKYTQQIYNTYTEIHKAKFKKKHT